MSLASPMSDNWNFMKEKPSEKLPEWKPTKYVAQCCGSVIFSLWSGKMCWCDCGEAFVDQTRYYERSSGNIKELKETPSE